ncbi:hypothetical protein Y1Q_0006359 [Alligator mississippiensis]|uniref:Uncharacterized protein n=1 Tax=Alligator mississippiensis TaxID=8496 RepID=A0A151NY74_ALLMI|nr:hypothetical protein Y1Q_0006359 [Alligator mississippiensis]
MERRPWHLLGTQLPREWRSQCVLQKSPRCQQATRAFLLLGLAACSWLFRSCALDLSVRLRQAGQSPADSSWSGDK